VAEPVFLSNMTLYKNVAQHFRLLWLFWKMAKECKCPIGENSPNLVTLLSVKRL
jgi:hypothetical protein